MRSVLVLSSFLVAAAIPVFAAEAPANPDDSHGPRLLEQVRRQPPKSARADIRVDVNMALVPVTVMDPNGHNVTGLGRENFRVLDGKEAVPIVHFGRQDAPVTVGLVYDCSRSMTDKYKTAREAATELYKQLNPDDESFLITVSDRAELRQDLTSNFGDIQNALMFAHPTGTTSLIDGVALALNRVKQANNPKRALIVVSDGGDNNSRYTLRELLSRAVESDIQIFAIGLYKNPQTLEEADGPELLRKLCDSTGGVDFVVSDVNDMRGAMGKIGVTLHNQYVLGYYPPDDAPSGKYRKIKVQLLVPSGLPPLKIYARNGYFVPGR